MVPAISTPLPALNFPPTRPSLPEEMPPEIPRKQPEPSPASNDFLRPLSPSSPIKNSTIIEAGEPTSKNKTVSESGIPVYQGKICSAGDKNDILHPIFLLAIAPISHLLWIS